MNGLTVLIVDDDTDSASEMAELLELSGYQTLVAHSLDEARQSCARIDPDCALIDVRLGTESGLELALEWQAQERPAVMLLSGAELTRAQAAQFTSAPPLLLKPASLERLADWLEAQKTRAGR